MQIVGSNACVLQLSGSIKMKNSLYLFLFFSIGITACAHLIRVSYSKSSMEDYPVLKERLEEKEFTPNKNFFILNKSTDSTCKIIWGNGKVTRSDAEEVDFYIASKLHYQWENSNYLILKAGTGAGAWLNMVLPFDKSEKVKTFDNILCFDSVNNLVASQYYNDTVLVVQNLKTQQLQYIILNNSPCEAASNLYCIDSVAIKNKELYLKWATTNLAKDSSRIFEERRYRIKI